MNTKEIPKNKLAFVVHEKNNVPRYFEINRSLLRFFIIILPIISLISLTLISAGIFYFKSINDILKRQESGTVKALKEKHLSISKNLSILKEHNQELEKRLASTSVKSLDVLNLIKFTSGQVDKSRFSTIELESPKKDRNFTPIFDSKQIHLKFNLLNKSPTNQRQSGFLFVVMKTGDLVQIYPQNSFSDDAIQIVFNRGEVFGFNRLRFVHATFDLLKKKSKTQFMVLLFNKLGDLIHSETILYETQDKQ